MTVERHSLSPVYVNAISYNNLMIIISLDTLTIIQG